MDLLHICLELESASLSLLREELMMWRWSLGWSSCQGCVVPTTTPPLIWPSNGQILRGPYQKFLNPTLMEGFDYVNMTNCSYLLLSMIEDLKLKGHNRSNQKYQNGFVLMSSPWLNELIETNIIEFGWVELILSSF